MQALVVGEVEEAQPTNDIDDEAGEEWQYFGNGGVVVDPLIGTYLVCLGENN